MIFIPLRIGNCHLIKTTYYSFNNIVYISEIPQHISIIKYLNRTTM